MVPALIVLIIGSGFLGDEAALLAAVLFPEL